MVITDQPTRRPLSESQRALIAAKIATVRQGERTDLPQICERLSRTEAADLLNVSPRSVDNARVAVNNGVPGLTTLVERDQLSVSAAAEIAKLPELEQRERVDKLAVHYSSESEEWYTPTIP